MKIEAYERAYAGIINLHKAAKAIVAAEKDLMDTDWEQDINDLADSLQRLEEKLQSFVNRIDAEGGPDIVARDGALEAREDFKNER